MLIHSDFPVELWVDASYTATYTINILPSSVLGGVSPFEKLFHHPPSYHILKTFGCACFPLLMDSKISKLQPKSKRCIFIGYAVNYKVYPCQDPITHKIYISCHVLFHEHKFRYRSLVGSNSSVPFTSPSVLIVDWSPTNVANVLHVPSDVSVTPLVSCRSSPHVIGHFYVHSPPPSHSTVSWPKPSFP